MKSWKEITALYQIYPRSFKDSNGDGVGDLAGACQKLDYLKELGVDAVWLSPFYCSPQADCGYDVSDYYNVDPLFGSMEDFDRLIKRAHQLDIKVMLDFVANHTSNQHEWFRQACQSLSSPYRNYYVWRDARPDGSEPTNWRSLAGGKSWAWHEPTKQHYLHSFMPEQPDLNWDNAELRQEMCNVLRFWLQKGADGFRVDAAWPVSKIYQDETCLNPAAPDDYGSYTHDKCKNGPKMITYMKEMAAVMQEYPDALMVFEYYTDEQASDEINEYRQLANINPGFAAPFVFDLFRLPWHAEQRANRMQELYQAFPENVLPVHALGNHDQTRIATRFGERQARALAVAELTLPGIPTIYYGEELGLKNHDLPAGVAHDNFTEGGGMGGRDPERTPMQWDDTLNAGFSSAKPWLPVAGDYQERNVKTETGNPQSFLSLYKRLLALRKQHAALKNGKYSSYDSGNGYVWSYQISGQESVFVVHINFADAEQIITTIPGKLLVSAQNDIVEQTVGRTYNLQPFDAIIIKKENS